MTTTMIMVDMPSPGADHALLVEVLRQARLDRDMSLRRLAELLNVSRRSVHAWEGLEATPTVEHLTAWARVLDRRLVVADTGGREIDAVLRLVRGKDSAAGDLRVIAAVLRERRKAQRRLSQANLAGLLGRSRASVVREEAVGPSRLTVLTAWTAALDCILWLCMVRGEPQAGEEVFDDS